MVEPDGTVSNAINFFQFFTWTQNLGHTSVPVAPGQPLSAMLPSPVPFFYPITQTNPKTLCSMLTSLKQKNT